MQIAGNQDVPLQQGPGPEYPLKVATMPYIDGGITTANGAAGGDTAIDDTRLEVDDFWNTEYALLITSGACAGQIRHITDWDLATWTFTVAPVFTAQILLGVTYRLVPIVLVAAGGSEGVLLLQNPVTHELLVEDTGVHTNPEQWLQDNHWDCDEVEVAAAGVGGEENLGAVVGAGLVRRIREITIRHAGTNNTVVTILVSGGTTKLTIDVPAQTTRVWSSEDGRTFIAAQQPAVQTSDVTGGSTFVSASGVEK